MAPRLALIAVAALLLGACAGPPLKSNQALAGRPMPPMDEPGVSGPSAAGKFDAPPRRLSGDAPAYPRRELVQGTAGAAVVEFTIDVDGMTRDFRVVSASEPVFGQQAVVAVQGWRFAPATKAGNPVAIRARQSFDFRFR